MPGFMLLSISLLIRSMAGTSAANDSFAPIGCDRSTGSVASVTVGAGSVRCDFIVATSISSGVRVVNFG